MNQPFNNDGFLDVITGLGTRRDPIAAAQLAASSILREDQLTELFRSGGVARTVVEMPAEEMVRPWFDVVGTDDSPMVLDFLETLYAQPLVTEALVWSRLYGGAAIIHVVDDGRGLDAPLDERRVRRVLGYRVVDRYRMSKEPGTSSNPVDKLLGRPEHYRVTVSGGAQVKVHSSRMSFLSGKRVPPYVREVEEWDDSVLQACFDDLQRLQASLGYSTSILKDFVQTVLKVKGLTNLIATGKEDLVKRRVQLLDISRSILNAMIIDADGEDVTKLASTVGGIPELLDRVSENLCAACGIPVSKLFGRSPGGLQSTGKSEIANFHDFLAAERQRVLAKPLEQMLRLVFLSKEGPTGGVEPENWSIEWRPFEQSTDKETAELRKLVADTDKIYVDAGVLAPNEVAESRFGTGEWSMETQLVGGTERALYASPEELPAVVDNPGGSAGSTPDESATEASPTDSASVARQDMEPAPLYVQRKLKNGAALRSWAEGQGIAIPEDQDLHVTVLYSRAPVDWLAVPEDWSTDPKGTLTVPSGGPRVLEVFGEGEGRVLVLSFVSSVLRWRHEAFMEVGASHDWDKYQPHITLGPLGDVDLGAVEPYQGVLQFGPEIFERLDP